MAHNPLELHWIRPPQQARSQRTLERILDAAETLVSEKGFEGTSVAEVASCAGSSVGAFYSRFRDKDGLLFALHDRFLEQATATADDALDPQRWAGQDTSAILEVVVRFLVAIYRERSGLLRAFVLRNQRDSGFRERQGRLTHHVSTKLAALLLERRDEMSHENPERSVALGIVITMSAIEAAILFREFRSGGLVLSDDDFAAELTLAFLAYLGVGLRDQNPERR